MSDLINNPIWRPEHLGRAIPDSLHATSVCLPEWADNVAYEEGDARVVDALQAGYPRFVFHPLVQQLHAQCKVELGRADEFCLAFPNAECAHLCADFVVENGGSRARVEGYRELNIVIAPEAAAELGKAYWQHTGEGVSSRVAEATLGGGDASTAEPEAKQEIRQRLADLIGNSVDDVFLFPSGMTAIYTAHRALRRLLPERRSVQFGFPYVDALKVQEKWGAGVHFLERGNHVDVGRLERLLADEPISGVFCEFPSNPLLIAPDLAGISRLCREHGVPLVVDDTIGTVINVDVRRFADLVTTSPTKSFSGVGDVMAGSLALNPESPLYGELKSALHEVYVDSFSGLDARVLAQNSRGFEARVRQSSDNASRLCRHLQEQSPVTSVFYPEWTAREQYNQCRREGGGFGSLFSMELVEPERNAPRFFDALEICKGPSLGTDFSLACPYTILAHYDELERVEACGVSRYLIRVSVGLEQVDELISTFNRALAACED